MARRRKARRANGEGGVYLRADTGRYLAAVPVGYTAKGNVRRVSKSFDTKAEAQAWISEQQQALRQGARLGTGATLREAFEEWLANGETLGGWAPATKAGYEDILGRFVMAQLGHVRVRDVTTSDVKRVLRDHAKAGASPSMLRRVRRYLSTLMEDVRSQRLIPYNPVLDVKLPKAPDPEVQRWSEAEVAAVVRACLERGDQVARYVLVALGTGLRTEELLGLTWAGVDLEGRQVTVTQVAPAGSKKHLRSEGKSENALRTVAIDSFTADTLRAQRAHVDELKRAHPRMNEKRAAQGLSPLPWSELDLVFCTSRGTLLDRGTLRRHFNEIRKAADVPHIKLYATRSTHGSLLADSGVNLHALAERLGHADPRFTAKVYLKGSSSAHRAVADQVGALLEAARSNGVAESSGKPSATVGRSGKRAARTVEETSRRRS